MSTTKHKAHTAQPTPTPAPAAALQGGLLIGIGLVIMLAVFAFFAFSWFAAVRFLWRRGSRAAAQRQ